MACIWLCVSPTTTGTEVVTGPTILGPLSTTLLQLLLLVVVFPTLCAALCAAFLISSGLDELEILGNMFTDSGKLSLALRPRKCSAAKSYAVAAISGVSKLPSQILVFFPGSLISDTHFPHFLFLTPL
ncbi:hypothetical protein Scep_002911 [Stephania cephalantha]|uniref:Uncharacterized protein n=1 Tax=Stephania cephalantha TaxID=152367 RepID=A0AAP0LBW4_9MAGN